MQYSFIAYGHDNSNLEYALSYIKAVWKLCPVSRENDKWAYLMKWGTEWIETETQVREYWQKYPRAGMAILTGKKSGVTVLDFDRHGADGFDSLKELESILGKLPDTLTVNTPRNGMHCYFKYVPGIKSVAGIAPGIDIRNDGALAIAPPSVKIVDGEPRCYEWDVGYEEIAELPKAWVQYLRDETSKKRSSSGDNAQQADERFELPDIIDEGKRNDALFHFACSMRGKGIKATEILNSLKSANKKRCNPPLEDEEIEEIFNSAMGYDYNPKHVEIISDEIESLSEETVKKLVSQYGLKSTKNIRWVTDPETGRFIPILKGKNPDEVEAKELEFLVPGWIPRGAYTIFVADGGIGKTSVTAAIVSPITNGFIPPIFNKGIVGAALPPSDRVTNKVMVLTNEASVAYSYKRKLVAYNGSCQGNAEIIDNEDGRENARMDDIALLNYIRVIKPALLVLDPMQAYLPKNTDMNSKMSVNNALDKLTNTCAEIGTALIICAHTRKGQTTFGRDRVNGSAELMDGPRAAMFLNADRENNRLYLSMEKANDFDFPETIILHYENGIATFEQIDPEDRHDVDFHNPLNTAQKKGSTKCTVSEKCAYSILKYLSDQPEHKALHKELKEHITVAEDFTDNAFKGAMNKLRPKVKQHREEGTADYVEQYTGTEDELNKAIKKLGGKLDDWETEITFD